MDELLQVKNLKEDANLFNREFDNLKNFYFLTNEDEIRNFILIHPGIIIILNEYGKLLKKYFSNAVFELKFDPDLSGSWFDLISLNIWVDEERFYNGSAEVIRSMNRELRPLRRKLDLLGEVLLSKRILK